MFQYATAYAVAKKRNFKIAAEENPIHKLFELNYEVLQSNNQNPLHNYTEPLRKQNFNPELFKVGPNTQINGFFQTDKYFINQRNDLIKIFTPREKTNQPIQKNNKFLITAHIRLGDYAEGITNYFLQTEFNKYYQNVEYCIPVLDANYYISALKIIFETIKSTQKDCMLIIISDSPGHIILKHILNSISRELADLNISTYTSTIIDEFTIMRNSDACITSASSFSWWAAWLSTTAQVIISPKYWLNYYLYPSRTNCSYPQDIEMSLPNQKFIYSQGYAEF